MLFGVDYYPEHWSRDRWAIDVKMMKKANINVVRMGEFAWSLFEPNENDYKFEWLDEVIYLLAEQGIMTILGTPTATPPKWLMDEYPEIYPVDVYGRTKGFGTRRHYCANNSDFQRKTTMIVNEMVNHFKNNPNVIAWQVDNEFSAGCYCNSCKNNFKKWLKEKYKSIENVNEAWGTVFWNQQYRDFDEIITPMYSSSDGFAQNSESNPLTETPKNHNPGLQLDYSRFQSDSVVSYQQLQIDCIRKITDKPVTHNFMGHFNQLDYFNLGRELDIVSWDCYPDMMWGKSEYQHISMAHDLMRGIKNKNFWMMEQQSGPCGWQAMGNTPEPGQIRLWTFQSIAHGAEGMLYFRWRPALYGTEQYWHGILDHDGIGRRRYKEVTQIGEELKVLSDIIVDSKNDAKVCLIKSYDNNWSHEAQPHNARFNYNQSLYSYYKAFHNNGVTIDVTSVDVEFHQYQVVIMPNFNLCSLEIQKKCENFVKEGGNLIITYRSGTRHWNNQLCEETLPGYFRDVSGVELKEYDSISFGRKVDVVAFGNKGKAEVWCDVIDPKDAKVLGTYDSHYYKGEAALTVNCYGKGKAYYVGCDLDVNSLSLLAREVLTDCGLEVPFVVEGVEIINKKKDKLHYKIILNYNNEEETIKISQNYEDLITGTIYEDVIVLDPYGVRIVK